VSASTLDAKFIPRLSFAYCFPLLAKSDKNEFVFLKFFKPNAVLLFICPETLEEVFPLKNLAMYWSNPEFLSPLLLSN
jgi:hypothetical protein